MSDDPFEGFDDYEPEDRPPGRTVNDLLARLRRWLNHEIELPNMQRGRDETKAQALLEYDWSKDSYPEESE